MCFKNPHQTEREKKPLNCAQFASGMANSILHGGDDLFIIDLLKLRTKRIQYHPKYSSIDLTKKKHKKLLPIPSIENKAFSSRRRS